MAYLGCQMTGLVRLNHIDRVLPEGVLAEAIGIPQWMSENTEQRFLKRATEETLKGVDELIQRRIEEESLRKTSGGQPKNLRFFLTVHASDMKKGRWEELVAQSPKPWRWVNSTTEVKELGSIDPWEESLSLRGVAVRREKRDPKNADQGGPRQWDLRYLIVTNVSRRKMKEREVFQRYHQRQWEEFSFKDGKQSLATAKMPTQSLKANRMHVKMVALAQVILKMFARAFLPPTGRYGPTCKTIREKVISVGGKNRGGQGGGAGTGVLRVPLATTFGREDTR